MKKMNKDRLAYNNAYNKANYKGISIRLNAKTEADIIDWLSGKDTKACLVQLIRKEMRLEKRRERERMKKDEDIRTDECNNE